MDLNKATTAFLACHWENDVVGPDGAFAPFFRAEVERRGVLAVAKRVLDGARRAGAQVVYARVAFKDGHSDLVTNIPLLGVVAQQGSLLDGTPATEIVDELKPEADDWNLANPKVSAFAPATSTNAFARSGSTPSSSSASPPTSRWRALGGRQATWATASSSSRTPAPPPTRQPTTPPSPRSASSARSPPPTTSSRPSDPQPRSPSRTTSTPTPGPRSSPRTGDIHVRHARRPPPQDR